MSINPFSCTGEGFIGKDVRSFLSATLLKNWPERTSLTVTSTPDAVVPIAWRESLGNAGNTFCLVAGNGQSFHSSDGRAWRTGTAISFAGAPTQMALGEVDGGPAFMVGDSATGSLHSSADGGASAWVTRSTGGALGVVNSVCWAESLGLWVAGGFGQIAFSLNGVSWAAATLPASWTGASNKTIARIVWNGSLFVAISATYHNEVLTSPDGAIWTARTLPMSATWDSLICDPFAFNRWAVATQAGYLVQSLDGVHWTTIAATGFHGAHDMACLGGAWVATSTGGDYGGVTYSLDCGLTWRQATVSPQAPSSGWRSVIAADGRFLLAATSTAGTAIEVVMSQVHCSST